MRRLLVGLLAFLGLSGTILTLPVWAAPAPEPEPVETSTDAVAMGSVADPAPAADVQEGTTDPVPGVPATAPTLTVSRTDVDEFSLVGVTWAYDPAVTDTVVQVRVQDADGDWGGWTEVQTEDGEQNPDADAGSAELRGGTAPLWTGPSTGVEAELVTRSGAQPTDVALDLVDPGTSEADGELQAPEIQDTADAALAMPDVYSRAQWGADERLRTWAPQYAPTIKAATLHHTDNTNNYTADQVPAMLRSIYTYHARTRGWGDIGYNVIVDKFGRRWEGRYGGLASTVIGAHAGGFNSGTFGVSMLGNYSTVSPPQVVVDSVAAIIGWKFALYGVDPRGTTVLTSGGGGTAKYAAGVRVTLPTIFGHRDVGSTTCPGNGGYAKLPEIRSKVAGIVLSLPQPTISERYASDASVRTLLGAKVGTEQVTAGVSWQQYQYGRLYWTARTGAHVLVGDILAAYLAAGGPAALGAPTTDETVAADNVGRYNDFADASIYWTMSTGARVVQGRIREVWQATGGVTGPLGYPVTNEVAAHGGRLSTFQGGIGFWTPATGASEVHGDIFRTWNALGGWTWGAPTSAERAVGAGRYGTFGSDRAIYWSKTTGARSVQGQIYGLYRALGGPTGSLGFPTADEQGAAGGVRFSLFQNGGAYWSPATGPHAVVGDIARHWADLGGLGAGFGVPVTNELTTPDRIGRYTLFASSAAIYWTKATGAQSLRGRIWEHWGVLGWERGPLGYPLTDEQATEDGRGRFNLFQNGSLIWTPAFGAHAVYGDIFRSWLAQGAVRSDLGYPVGDEHAVAGGRAQDFEHGRLVWKAATGKVTTERR